MNKSSFIKFVIAFSFILLFFHYSWSQTPALQAVPATCDYTNSVFTSLTFAPNKVSCYTGSGETVALNLGAGSLVIKKGADITFSNFTIAAPSVLYIEPGATVNVTSSMTLSGGSIINYGNLLQANYTNGLSALFLNSNSSIYNENTMKIGGSIGIGSLSYTMVNGGNMTIGYAGYNAPASNFINPLIMLCTSGCTINAGWTLRPGSITDFIAAGGATSGVLGSSAGCVTSPASGWFQYGSLDISGNNCTTKARINYYGTSQTLDFVAPGYGATNYVINDPNIVIVGNGTATGDPSSGCTHVPYVGPNTLIENSGAGDPRLYNTSNTQAPLPIVPFSYINYCQGAVAQPLSATNISTATAQTWYTSLTGNTGKTTTPPTPVTASGTSPITYYVSQTVNGCEGPRAPIHVTVSSTAASPTSFAIPGPSNVCVGGTIAFTGPAGYNTYNWTGPASYSSTAQSPTVSSSATSNMAGTYSLLVAQGWGTSACNLAASQTITVGAWNAPTSNPATGITCTQFTANWSSNGATNYILEVGTSPSPFTGIFSIALGNVTSYTVTGLSANTTYYYRLRSSVSGCASPYSAVQTVNMPGTVTTPIFTLGSTSTRCQAAGTINYGASASNTSGPITYSLDAASISAGNSINSSTGDVTFLDTWNGGMLGTSTITASAPGCGGPITATHTVTINPAPSAPTITNGIRCGTGTVNLSASGSPSTYNWYAASSGGGSLATTANYTTPSISSTTTYYVTSVSAANCESIPRTSVVATISSTIPSAPTVTNGSNCGTGTVNLSASGSPATYNWYAASSGGSSLAITSTYTTPPISSTTTYYVTSVTAAGCESTPRTAVTATINSFPSAPTVTGGSKCGSGTVNLTASGPSGTFTWYDALSGGNTLMVNLNTSSTFSTPNISTTTSYYVTLKINGCESSPRTQVTATINTIPSAPTVTNGSSCGTGTVNLSASGSPATYNWYAASSGGSSLATTSTYTTPSISSTTTYYVTAASTLNCESTPRTAVTATINTIPSAPTVTNGSNCGTGTVNLSASGSPSTYNWYSASSGGSSLAATTATYTTPSISSTTTYFVTSVSAANCESSPRTAVTATINTIPSAPTVTNGSNCGTGTVNLSASGSPSTYNWFSASSGGSSLATTASYTTPSISGTTTYYVTAVSAVNCESSPRTAITATINTIPSAPTVINGSNCGTGTVNLSASGSSATYNWYSASSGGTSLATTSSYTTPSISTTTTFYVTAVSALNCESTPRTSVVATINSIPSGPSTVSQSRCGPGTLNISASGSPLSYNWYSATSGGSSLATTGTYSTPVLSTTTVYYVTSVDASGCESTPRKAVNATIKPLPAAPSVTDGSNCGTGTVTLSASGSPATYNWYTSSSGGSSLATTASYTTPSISTTTTYYVSVLDAANCASSPRTPVVATINTVPSAPTIINGSNCGTGTVNLSASGSPSTYNWYNASSGGSSLAITANYTTPSISSTTTYYVTSTSAANCESTPRTAVTATINTIPSVPTITNGSKCGTGTVNLLASGSPSTYNWYSLSSGGTSLATTATYTTPSITSTTTYYVTSTSAANCESTPRTAVTATINTIPSAPTVTNGSNCGTGTVNLSASGSPSTYNWYNASSGGSSLATTINYTTPSISSTTTYYVTAVSSANCESSPRTSVTATINSTLSAPSVTNGSSCGTGTVNLSASGSPGGYNWYSASTGGSAIASTAGFTTPTLSNTTTYFVTASSGSCESSPRTAVVATINSIPSTPTVTNGSNCGTGTVNISASGSPATYNWYNALSGGSSLATTANYTTPSISSTTNYFVTSVNAGCESTPRIAVVANINSIPSAPAASNGSKCGTGTVNLSASGSPATYNWYNASSGGSSLATTANYTTPSISSTTTYYVTASSAGCESSRIPVTATINPIPADPSGINGNICGSGKVSLTASGSPFSYNWYDNQTGGTLLSSSSATFNTPTISQSTDYYVSSLSSQGCESNNRSLVTAVINLIPSPPIAKDSIRCSAGPVTLVSSGSNGSYHWYNTSSGGSSLNNNSNYTTPTLTATTTYYVSSVSIEGCESDTRTQVNAIIIQSMPLPSSADVNICGTGSPLLSASGSPDTYRWYDVSTGGTSLANGSTYSPNISTDTTYFYVSSVLGTCEGNRTQVRITMTPTPIAGTLSSLDSAFCSIPNAGIVNLSGQSGSEIKWFSSSDNFKRDSSVIDSIRTNYSFTNLNSTIYYKVKVKTKNCSFASTNSLKVNIYPVTNPGVLIGQEINDENVLLSISNQVGSIRYWEVSRDSNFTTNRRLSGTTSEITVDNNNQLYYRAAIQSGLCALEYSNTIKIDSFMIYHAVSPNDDNLNDTWVIHRINLYPKNKVSIYDRWGSLIYYQEGYNNDDKVWNGQCNTGLKLDNKPVEDGTYFYHIDIGKKHSYTGYVVLRR